MRNAVLLFAFILAACSPADQATDQPAQLRVISGGAVQRVERELAAQFTAETGIEVIVTTGTAGQVRAMVESGEPADVVVITEVVLAGLVEAGLVRADTIVPIGSVGVGVAVREGVPHPPIATTQEFRTALLAADSVVYVDPATGATSGTHIGRVLEQLGIADIVNAKAVLIQGGSSAEVVARGEAEMALQQMSELVGVPGVVLVGPLPDELQISTTYSGSIHVNSADPETAGAFIRYLTRPETAARWIASGVTPPN